MWQPPIYKTGFVRSLYARHLYILPFNIYIHFISTQMKNETATIFNLWLWYVIFGSWSFVCVFKQTVVLRSSFFINLWFDIRTHLYQLSIAVGTVSTNTHNLYIHRNFAELYESKKKTETTQNEDRSLIVCGSECRWDENDKQTVKLKPLHFSRNESETLSLS